MKNKIVFKSQKDFVKWVTVSNMFAKSRIMPMVALKQFNSFFEWFWYISSIDSIVLPPFC